MSEALCCDLRAAVESRSLGAGAIGSVSCRVCVVLYLLLSDHLVDRRGRCLSCRRSGAVLGQRRRKCRIHVKASFWLRQPDEVVLRHLAQKLNHRLASAPGTGGRPDLGHLAQPASTGAQDVTQVGPRIAVDQSKPSSESLQTLATPTPPRHRGGAPRAGRSDPDHGGTGVHPDSLRSRRAPFDDHTPYPGQASCLVVSGRSTEVLPGAD
ncbi:MAG: hypothetical protein M3460_20155 [Actinomycetota bacterium]|nr:hypothetical protein [Actinomycetota bacterium]